MKYIRTKDRIFRIKATPQSNAMYSGSQTYCIYDHIEMVDRDIIEKDIIKQADTIEELCDEFVVIYEDDYHALFDCLEEAETQLYVEIYGAIWTDKGLIYVAKMNEEGVLCLI